MLTFSNRSVTERKVVGKHEKPEPSTDDGHKPGTLPPPPPKPGRHEKK